MTAKLTGPPEADAAVIEQSWTRPERFSAIFERYFGQIHQYLARRVGDKAADDLAAEVFVAAFTHRRRYDLARDCARPWPVRDSDDNQWRVAQGRRRVASPPRATARAPR